MSLHVNTLFLFLLNAHAGEEHFREASRTKRVYARPGSKALKGMIPAHSSFAVQEVLEGTSSCPQGWGRVHEGGVVCLSNTEQTTEVPSDKEMLSFVPPDPLEYDYDFSNPPEVSFDMYTEPFVPHINARIAQGKRGRLWESVEAYERGDRPNWRLKEEREYRFVDVIETDRGIVLERPNGKVTPVAEWYVYPVSQFFGRDLNVEPIPKGEHAAWIIEKDDAPIFLSATNAEAPVYFAQFQEALNVYETDTPDWYGIPDLFGTGQDGYIQNKHIRLWEPATLPVEVDENQIWIDVHLPQQTLALYQGENPLFVTLISSAKKGFSTPTGVFSLYSKATSWDLGSLPNAQEAYFMEHVPWVMHFFPRYALHSAFWHADFGIPSSHGCINMSPRDIAYIFEKTQPILPKGWWVIRHDDNDLGSVVRIRKGSTKLPDKRLKK